MDGVTGIIAFVAFILLVLDFEVFEHPARSMSGVVFRLGGECSTSPRAPA